MNDAAQTTPADLAEKLGVSPKRLRDFLRSRYGHETSTKWVLSFDQIQEARAHFSEVSRDLASSAMHGLADRQLQLEAVPRAASHVLDAILGDGRSLIDNSRQIWTEPNARALVAAILGEDPGGGHFWDRLHVQVGGRAPEVVLFAAEAAYLRELPAIDIRPDTKLAHIAGLLALLEESPAIPEQMLEGMRTGGVFRGGMGYHQQAWRHLIWVCDLVITWNAISSEERESARTDAWAFRHVVTDRLVETIAPEARTDWTMRGDSATPISPDVATIRNAALFMRFPNEFEPIISDDHKRRIRDSFADVIGGSRSTGGEAIDRDLLRIRETIQPSGEGRINFYLPPYVWKWRPERRTGRGAWLVRPIRDVDELTIQWQSEGFVSLSARNLDLDTAAASIDTIRDAVRVGYGGLDYPGQFAREQEFTDFILHMQLDDIVIGLIGEDVVMGTIEGGPELVVSEGSRLRRPVSWSMSRIPRNSLPTAVRGLIDRHGSVVNLGSAQANLEGLMEVEDPVELDELDEEGADMAAAAHRAGSIPRLKPASAELAAKLHMPIDALQEYIDLLHDRQQVVFYGPPGTGKTYVAREIARHIVGVDTSRARVVQFHPSYAYEDFFEGLRPVLRGDVATFDLKAGPLREIAAAASDPDASGAPFVLVIDEMNRANLAKVFGELYYLLEYRDEPTRLQYSDQEFSLPNNLFIIGTMNTVDRSISLVDAAIRRRFPFVEFHPEAVPVSGVLRSYLAANGMNANRARLLDALNRGIKDRDLQIGPSYLMKPAAATDEGLRRIWKYDVLPLLEEHYFGEYTPPQIEAQFGLAALMREVSGASSGSLDPSVPSTSDSAMGLLVEEGKAEEST